MRLNFFLLGAPAVMAAFVLLSWTASAASFNYLYIEASEGNSSGGHTAIQFDDEVYHFQHMDAGLIRLFRQQEKEFHFLYRYLQNRPIHLGRVEVSDDTYELLKDQFKWQFLAQERQFKLIDDLRRDRILLRNLLQKSTGGQPLPDSESASVLRLKGVGLFFPEPKRPLQYSDRAVARAQSLIIEKLRQKLELHYGRDFLHRKSQQLESQIKALTPANWSTLAPDLADKKYPASVYSFFERYSDHLSALYAIKALTEATPLQPDVLLQINRQDFNISETEKRGLQELESHLTTALINAFESNRPDWGYTVLVNLARYLAIETTLQSGYWTFIDDFADSSEWLKPDQYFEHQAQLRILLSDARQSLDHLRRSVVFQNSLTEAEYSQIEMMANRYLELLKSEQYREFRFNGEKALPSKSIGFPEGPVPGLTEAQITAELSSLENIEDGYMEALNHLYRYDLVSRNCVTELFGIIHQALLASYRPGDSPTDWKTLTRRESEKRLGGFVDASVNFIPFVSYRSVLDHYRVVQSLELDSYRRLELAKLKTRKDGLLAAFREASILSSRLYKYNPDDALFVFFTDDQLLFRPLFGLANIAAGIGQSAYGFFSWPVDSGKNLKSGATGILMSLPELFFFNMRKGSYKYLSFNRLTHADSPGN